MLMGMCSPTFNIYQGAVAPNCFKSHTNSWCPDFFQKKKLCLMSGMKFTFSDLTLFLPDNLPWLKKDIFRPGQRKKYKNMNILKSKKAFSMNLKAFLIIFKDYHSMKKKKEKKRAKALNLNTKYRKSVTHFFT